MKASFVIPVYGHLEVTRLCVESLLATIGTLDSEIIIVDDGSPADVKSSLRQLAAGKVKLVAQSQNSGYAKANNRGASEATGEILFLVNNDLEFLPGWLEPMLDAFDKFPDLGLVGNVQLNAATEEIDHSGYYVEATGDLVHKRSPNKALFGTPAYSKFHLITGACCAIRRDVYQRLGGFDEAFVNGCEDIDLCLRIGQAKKRILVANRSVVKHKVSSTRGPRSLNDERNSRLLQQRWGERLAQLAAYNWPETYLKALWQEPKIATSHALKQAIPRFLMLKSGPAPTGLAFARSHQARNERHWKSILDHWTDEMIKRDLSNQHANWLTDRIAYDGLSQNAEGIGGVWIREKATITIPKGQLVSEIAIRGMLRNFDSAQAEGKGPVGLKLTINQNESRITYPIVPGAFRIVFEKPPVAADQPTRIDIELVGVWSKNLKAYLARKLKSVPYFSSAGFQAYRSQAINRRLSLYAIELNGETALNFEKNPTSPLIFEYVKRHGGVGVNLVGWFKAELGIGESARLAAKALKTTHIGSNFVPLKVNCLANQGDTTYDSELTNENPYPINIFHIDAPQSADIDHHHGPAFRQGKRNIAYWAWELPEFPDRWIRYFKYFDEIWTPSLFCREAIAMKSPVPVLVVPHCIRFSEPEGDFRTRFNLPTDKFLFLFAYDLNSYQARKNPQAVIDAYKLAFAGKDQSNVGLVIKTHCKAGNEKALAALKKALEGVENCYLIDETLPRSDVYGLMSCVDCYVSLHRSEGFGLTVAESMYLGKPVISTQWSATSEFTGADNSCPVRYKLIELTETHGPYDKGQLWADPSIEHAAEYMLRLSQDPEYAKRIGDQAAIDIRNRFSPEAVGNIYENRLKAMSQW